MTTGRIIIKTAMLRAGVIAKNENPTADEIGDGLRMLNDMLASWSLDKLLCYVRTEASFPLTSANQYSIGIGQQFNAVRPNIISAATIRWDNTDYPLTIMPDDMFEKLITDKNTHGLPRFISYNNGYPVGLIKLSPAPHPQYTLRLLYEAPLQEFSLDDEVILPPGWQRAIIWSLANEMLPEYGLPDVPSIERNARLSLGAIKRQVARSQSMDANPTGSIGAASIYTGYR